MKGNGEEEEERGGKGGRKEGKCKGMEREGNAWEWIEKRRERREK